MTVSTRARAVESGRGLRRRRGSGWEFTEPDQLAAAPAAAPPASGWRRARDRRRAGAGGQRPALHRIVGDGEFLFTPSALWTAANLKLPLLTLVNNNRSYGNDEGHQEHVAKVRGRPVENKGVGISLDGPQTDLAGLARSFGIEGFGPITEPDDLAGVFERAVRIVTEEKRPVLVDVITQNDKESVTGSPERRRGPGLYRALSVSRRIG